MTTVKASPELKTFIRRFNLFLFCSLACIASHASHAQGARQSPVAIGAPLQGHQSDTPSTNTKPNIVYILADDQGYGDARCYNPTSPMPTPGIDRIAREGMRFTDAHSASSVCTPSRYALLTGRYSWRTRLQKGVLSGKSGKGDPPLIAEDTRTVGGFLQNLGYQTAVIGKWHLGFQYEMPLGEKSVSRKELGGTLSVPVGTRIIGGPTTRGFDVFLGFHHAREMATWMQGNRVTENIHVNQMLPRITEASVAYIQQRAEKQDGPFFLYLPLSSPHTPIVPVAPWVGKSGLNAYADFAMQTDDTVVRVLDALDKTGLAKNTVVVFTADNGTSPRANIDELRAKGHGPLAGLRGHKADAWDGGHRVPFVIRWPGVVKPGSVSDELICQTSLLATLAENFDVALAEDEGVDSFSILPVLRGEKITQPTHPAVVHHSVRGKFALRVGDWKYLACKNPGGWSKGGDNKPHQLYNMKADRNESTNLVDDQPLVRNRLMATLQAIIDRGRSTPGPKQANDVPVKYQAVVE